MQQGPFAPQTLLCFCATTDPSVTLSPFPDFPVSPVIRFPSPPISRRGEEGFSSCLAHPCHRAVAVTPPECLAASVSLRRSMLPSPHVERLGPWGYRFEATCTLIRLRPDDSLTILSMALSIGFRDSVSFLLTIQATGLLTLALVGLPPTEYASFRWTHQHAGLSPRTLHHGQTAAANPAGPPDTR